MKKKNLKPITLAFTLVVLILSLYIMAQGIGTEGKDFGPGAYYYSDIPGWEDIFYPPHKMK